MINEDIEQLRYPIGKFIKNEHYSTEQLKSFIDVIEGFPTKIKNEVEPLSEAQLEARYRPGGWTIRQVVHHCADSHMNALIRFKHTLTENETVIKPYPEHLFAELNDGKIMPVSSALDILKGVHAKLVILARSFTGEELNRYYIHPEYKEKFTLEQALSLYAWHCNHHLAHITNTKKTKNW